MKNYLPFRIAGLLVLIVGMVHLSRLAFHFPIIIGGFSLPESFSLVAGVLLLALSVWMLKTLQMADKK